MATTDVPIRRGLTRRRFLTATAAGAAAVVCQTRGAAGGPAPQWRVGIYTRPWDQYDYRVALDEIAKAGFQYAGLMTTTTAGRRLVIDATIDPEEAATIGEQVRQRGLQIPSVYGGGFPVNKSHEAGVAGLKRLIDNCAAAGARTLLLGGIGRAELYDAYYRVVKDCCGYAAEKNLPITVKPHGGLNATSKQCRRCIELVGHENFSLWYDPGNIFYYSKGQLDPVTDAADAAGLVKEGMCVKDFHMVERDGQPAPDVWITPGQGRVDFPGVMRQLIRGGFTSGDLVIECVSRGDGALETIQAEARKARRFVEQLIAGL